MDYLDFFSDLTNHTFNNPALLQTALTHSSYSNENGGLMPYNERLEFLGDSVLSLIVSEYLYNANKKLPEGRMSKIRANLVCEASLAECAARIGLHNYLRLGKGEEHTGGRNRPSIMADAMEALIAALYLDAGFDKTRDFVLSVLSPHLNDALSGGYMGDYKTQLQEYIQGTSKEKIDYVLITTTGPDHNKMFQMSVLLDSKEMAKGIGRTKKDAQQEAAKEALVRLGVINE